MANRSPLDFFRDLVKIPRDTGDEKAVSDYLMDFARERGLEAVQDDAFNVVIRKPGTGGYEKAPALALQSHIDIVYIKSEDSDHVYGTPLQLVEAESTWQANGTSLGADNGVGVAYTLALLDSDSLPHPPLEGLFTTGEEAGMLGAMKLSEHSIQARRMLNLDSEDEGVFIVGCAGGQRTSVMLDVNREPAAPGSRPFLLRIQGLKGGHSGLEIDQGRGNALRLLGRALSLLRTTQGVSVSAVSGGTKMNAIPDRAEALLCLTDSTAIQVRALAQRFQDTFRNELSGSDPGVELVLEPAEGAVETVLDAASLKHLVLLLTTIPIGVQSMSAHLPGLVETSNNMGVLETAGDVVTVSCATRSSVGSMKAFVSSQIDALAAAAGARVRHDSSYPEWSYTPDSPLQAMCKQVYRELYGRDPEVMAVHAGLECGYFCALFPGLDVISIGPNITGVHTPSETLDLASTQRVWDYLKELVAALK